MTITSTNLGTPAIRRAAVATVATLLAAAGATGVARAAQTGDLVTVSLSGSTAMRNFTISQGFSYLTPGSSITLNSGAGGAPVSFTAPNTGTTQFQLAPTQYPASAGNEMNALRIEWHEQGSVEGILEMANDQIAPISGLPDRTPSIANPLWVNRGSFTTAGGANGFSAGTFGTAGGQSLVQMAISDVNARQGFSTGGGAGTFAAMPGVAGYGKGNAAWNSGPTINGLGAPGARQQLQDQSVLNMPAGAFGTGAWNTAGVSNLDNKPVAVTATLFVASPGTGLTRVNRNDAQWLQTTGRLTNGADFFVAERDPNSGTRNVAALNTGVDPSWAVGENDGGDGTAIDGATAQVRIGAGIKFGGKTAGGGQLRPTVQNARMSLGVLSMSDALGSVRGATASVTPLRGLDYSDSSDGSSGYVRASAASITDGSYVIWQNETYVTVKNPGAAFAADTAEQWAARTDAETGIRGDNAGHDVADVRGNILGSVFNFPGSSSVANPADQLLAASFILPQMVWKTKATDGVGVATNKSAGTGTDGPGYSASLRNALLGSSYAANFNVADPSSVTKGANGSAYGIAGGGSLAAGTINLTDNGAGGGNWLFGNFNQNGVRDFSSVKAATDAQAKLFASGAGVDANSGSINSTAVAGLSSSLANMTGFDNTAGAKKGDLIVMGDYNADGKFNGRDLYLLARGAALAANTGTDSLNTTAANFGDAVRSGVLRKNAALDYLDATATPQQKIDASADPSVDAGGTFAFNKSDVNRDGRIDRADFGVVESFVGKDYRNLSDQLSAVIATNGTPLDGKDRNGNAITETPRPISLVDVELNDTGDIQHVTTGTGSDAKIVHDAAVGLNTLLDGDTNLDGKVDLTDFTFLAANFNNIGRVWAGGDFNFDGTVDLTDFTFLAAHFNQSVPGETSAPVGATVPEPTGVCVIALAAQVIRRRRRRGCVTLGE